MSQREPQVKLFHYSALMDSDLDTKQFIVTNLKSRGDGRTTVYRYVTQLWTLDGKLILELDPHPDEEDANAA